MALTPTQWAILCMGCITTKIVPKDQKRQLHLKGDAGDRNSLLFESMGDLVAEIFRKH